VLGDLTKGKSLLHLSRKDLVCVCVCVCVCVWGGVIFLSKVCFIFDIKLLFHPLPLSFSARQWQDFISDYLLCNANL